MLRALAALAAILVPMIADAQGDSVVRQPARACWRGKPLPQCRSFVLAEVTGEYAFVSTRTRYTLDFGTDVETRNYADETSQIVWTVGPMFNTSPRRALGATLSAGFNHDGGRQAIELRHRRWLSPSTALDLSGGMLRMNIPTSPDHPSGVAYGLTTGGYLLGADLVQLNVHADLLFADGGLRGGATIGGGLGGYGAMGTTAIAAVCTIALILIVLHGTAE